MRLAAKRRFEWLMSDHFHEGREHRVRVGGEWLDVIEMGRGEPLVLLPGLAGSWKLLSPLAHVLAQRFRVLTCGLRGDRFPLGMAHPLDVAEYAEDVRAILDQLALERPAILGVSFGGAIALEFAAEHPQRLGALIVHGAEARFRASLGSTIARRVLERFPLPTDNCFVNQFFNLLHGGKPSSPALADFVVERCWETDQSVVAQRIGLLDGFDVSDRLWRIDAPTLVLAGSRDVVVSPGRQRALAESIASARFETLEGAGHVGFLTHRAELARRVVRHLRAVKHSHCEGR